MSNMAFIFVSFGLVALCILVKTIKQKLKFCLSYFWSFVCQTSTKHVRFDKRRQNYNTWSTYLTNNLIVYKPGMWFLLTEPRACLGTGLLGDSLPGLSSPGTMPPGSHYYKPNGPGSYDLLRCIFIMMCF